MAPTPDKLREAREAADDADRRVRSFTDHGQDPGRGYTRDKDIADKNLRDTERDYRQGRLTND